MVMANGSVFTSTSRGQLKFVGLGLRPTQNGSPTRAGTNKVSRKKGPIWALFLPRVFSIIFVSSVLLFFVLLSLSLTLSLTLVVTVQKVEQKSSVRNVFQTPLEVSLVSGCVMLGSLVSGIAQAVILLPHTTCVAVA